MVRLRSPQVKLRLFVTSGERAGHIGNTSKSMTKEEFIDKFIARLNSVVSASEQEMGKIASQVNKKARKP